MEHVAEADDLTHVADTRKRKRWPAQKVAELADVKAAAQEPTNRGKKL